MLKWYLTADKWSPQSKEEVIAGWNDGKPFRIYQSGGKVVTGNDVVRMKMAGVTHVHFVWQLENHDLQNHLLEL